MPRYHGRHRRPAPAWIRALRATAVGATVVMTAVAVWAPKRAPAEPVADRPPAAAPPQAPNTFPLLALTLPTTTTTTPPAPTTTPAPTRTTPRPPARTTTRAAPPPAACSSSGWNTQPHVARVGHHIAGRFGLPASSILGRGARGNASDHPTGLALDFMVGAATGDRLAAYALEHRAEFAVTYVIWEQRINHGSGWVRMADRGGVTANHFDHVHVSFAPSAGATVAC